MTLPMAAWRVSYAPGNWLVLSGPTMLVVLAPSSLREPGLVESLWDEVLAARSVNALVELLGRYGLDAMPDFAAFFWDDSGLHGMVRGSATIVDADTGEPAIDGDGVVTWREEELGNTRRLRVDMETAAELEPQWLPLVVGAASASSVHLSTDPVSLIRFHDDEHRGILRETPRLQQPEQDVDEEPQEHSTLPEFSPSTSVESPIPPPDPELLASSSRSGPAEPDAPDADHGTVFSAELAATHKPAAAPGTQQDPQVLAVPCARGHANAPGSRTCRLCMAPVDDTNPQLIRRPSLAGVHSKLGEFVDLHSGVLVGRAPDASKAPPGSQLMRVPSPSSDISRNHLLITPREWSIIVTDLNSTNGTTVIPAREQPFVLAGGDSVEVELGTVLDLGDGVALRIEPPRS